MDKELLKLHNSHITGSKVASILQIKGAYMSKYKLYLLMKGLIEEPERDETRLKMGQYAEEMIRKYTRMELGWVYERIPKNERFKKHPKYPFLGGLVDGIAKDGNDRFIVEMKNVDIRVKNEWLDDYGDFIIPEKFQCQVYFYMALFDLPAKIVPVFGGNDPVIIDLPRNPSIENFIITKCCEFWNELEQGIKPNIDGSPQTSEAIKMLFPVSNATMIDGDGLTEKQTRELILCSEKYQEIHKEIKTLEEEKSKYGNIIRERLGDNDGVVWSDGQKITNKKTKDGIKFDSKRFKEERLDLYNQYLVKKTGYRRLNIKLGGKKNAK